ncbi:MAG: hypothetical protein OER97_04275 [Gammaproteobacteria bacterium]|nr:hypothetical protein [Gammaproteobacteria bacterium]
MKLNSIGRLFIFGVCLLFASFTHAQTPNDDGFAFGFGHRVAGSYLIENLAIPEAGLDSLQALASMTSDGVVIVTDTDDFGLAATAPHSPKLGAWKPTGHRDIAITIIEFAYEPIMGEHIFTWRLEMAGQFADRSFNAGTGTLVAKLFPPVTFGGFDPLDPNSAPLLEIGGTFDFRRIKP